MVQHKSHLTTSTTLLSDIWLLVMIFLASIVSLSLVNWFFLNNVVMMLLINLTGFSSFDIWLLLDVEIDDDDLVY